MMLQAAPIPVQIAAGGFTWTTALVALLNVLVGGALVALIRGWAPLKKVSADREANLLKERATEMASMRDEIKALDAEVKKQAKEHATERESERKQFEAVIALYRHRTNNLDASFNALLLLLKKGVPVEEAVAAVEDMRREQKEREALEAATLRAAGINGFEQMRPGEGETAK